MDNNVTPKKEWVQRLNYIKNYVNLVKIFRGLELKTLALLGLLIYWAAMILAPFSQ
jgi:hypothetical protein